MIYIFNMFELEDYDLDDEVFLNTQMPSVVDKSPKKSSNLNFEDDDETFLNISNPVIKLEASLSQKDILKNNFSEEQNKNHFDLCNDIIHKTPTVEHKSESSKPDQECQSNKIKLNFDDGFDSDDEAFFNTPDILHESINSSNKDDYTTELKSNEDHNGSVGSFNFENHNPTYESSIIESTIKSDFKSHLNTTVTNIKSKTPKCTSRKFPGPAGLLSENEDLYSEDPSNLESLDMSISITENDKNEESLCTQANDSSFSSSPYQQFLLDFFMTDVDALLDKYNVAWIKQKILPYTASGRFFTDKIPFFVSVIKEIDCLSPDPTVLLADKTGQIRGTIHRAVWNQFSDQLKLGTVLILSKVGVSCQKIVKSFTLNITSDHLIAIYSFSSEDTQEVIVTRTTNLTNEEIINNAKRWNLFNVEALNKNPHSEIKSRMTALNNLKLHNILMDQNSQLSNPDDSQNSQIAINTQSRSTPVKHFFAPKIPVAHTLFKADSYNLPEEPPSKRIRNEECDFKTGENNSNNEMSIIQNIFEGIDEDEMFNDFCC